MSMIAVRTVEHDPDKMEWFIELDLDRRPPTSPSRQTFAEHIYPSGIQVWDRETGEGVKCEKRMDASKLRLTFASHRHNREMVVSVSC